MDLYTILGNIRKADEDFHLIEDGDRIAVGVSGGKDSMVLLTALYMYSKFKHKNFHVVGIHIKLGFPNMNFDEVVRYCKTLGVEFHMQDSKVYDILKLHPDANGNIKCSLCSKFKKATVISAAKEYDCNKVAFGHHSDDAVETMFMNMIYGGKLSVFLPKMYMTKTDITFIRPFVYAYENDILDAQQKNAIPFVKSTCPNDGYTKRQEIKELLHELYERYPMARYNFINMLSNVEQVDLWHKEGNKTTSSHFKALDILLEEGNIQLGKRGTRFFIIYTPAKQPQQRLHQQIPSQDGIALLNKICTLHDYLKQHNLAYSDPTDV